MSQLFNSNVLKQCLTMQNFVLNFILLSLYLTGYVSTGKVNYNLKIEFTDVGVDHRKDVGFFLYTRSNSENPQQLWVDDAETLEKSSFNASKPVKFVTHGWLNSYQGLNCQTIRKAFLDHDDFNVIIVDWNNIAHLSFLEAAGRIKTVGWYIAKMISFLESRGCKLSTMSLVGHSLGAHVVGQAGYQTTNKVGHIVGLDPAGPGFEFEVPANRISSEDAALVEIIHTNIGYYGITKPVGHADFYPNAGGPLQPGCTIEDADCSHDRAYRLYAEAVINPNGLFAVRCENHKKFSSGACDASGPVLFPNSNGQVKKPVGSYFLVTSDKSPFGLGINGTKPIAPIVMLWNVILKIF